MEFINMREKHRFTEGLKAFRDECAVVMKLRHRNIIEIIDFFSANQTAYLVMPYEYGMTLSRYTAMRRLDDEHMEQEIIRIMTGVCSAVQVFHDNNIIHLDLKPGNIWLRPNHEALILDFGTARILDDPIKSQQPPMHTPGFAAPEQHREFFEPSRVGVWTDFYGLGSTLYALLEKNAPPIAPQIIQNQTEIDISEKRGGQFSDELLRIVHILMQPSWEDRKLIQLPQIIERLRRIKPIANPIHQGSPLVGLSCAQPAY